MGLAPTTIGTPRHCGVSLSSTAAKNASMSKCAIILIITFYLGQRSLSPLQQYILLPSSSPNHINTHPCQADCQYPAPKREYKLPALLQPLSSKTAKHTP